MDDAVEAVSTTPRVTSLAVQLLRVALVAAVAMLLPAHASAHGGKASAGAAAQQFLETSDSRQAIVDAPWYCHDSDIDEPCITVAAQLHRDPSAVWRSDETGRARAPHFKASLGLQHPPQPPPPKRMLQ